MANPRYRASINGFWCHNETWDDAFNWDGKHDEVFLDVNTKVADVSGTITQNFDSESELMGDTWRLPGRVQAGSASDRGGIISGNKFPWNQPWNRQNGLNTTSRVPRYTIWEGELKPGRDLVFLTPTVWEWDPGAGAWDGWLEWQAQVDTKYGQRAKDIFSKIWPVSAPVFDAVSLGIQTVASLAGLWSPLGQSMRRPMSAPRPQRPQWLAVQPDHDRAQQRDRGLPGEQQPPGLRERHRRAALRGRPVPARRLLDLRADREAQRRNRLGIGYRPRPGG